MTTSDKPVITKETKMSKKKLETANENIPEDEMFLAMILQVAHYRNKKFSHQKLAKLITEFKPTVLSYEEK